MKSRNDITSVNLHAHHSAVFILFLTLSMRTVILCSVLAVQHEQSADTQFNRHCNPHAGETKAADKNQCQADAHDPDTAKVHQAWHESITLSTL